MKTTDKIIASVTRTFPAPAGYHGQLHITAQAYFCGSNKHPHFSVEGEISTPREHQTGDWQAGGCLHDEALKAWPKIRPIIDLHLSNADDGEPMHAEGNGFYALAGSVAGNFGERYHAGNSERHFPIAANPETPWKNTEYRMPTHDECLQFLAEHLRCTLSHAEMIRDDVRGAFEAAAMLISHSSETEQARLQRTKAGNAAAKACFAGYVAEMRPRWQQEAQNGLALIARLSEEGK